MFPPPQELGQRLGIQTGGAFAGDLVTLVAVVDIRDIALLGQFYAFPVGKFYETPELDARVRGLTSVKAVGATLLAHVLQAEVGLTSQRLDGLVQQRLGLGRVLLGSWTRRRRRRTGLARGRRREANTKNENRCN